MHFIMSYITHKYHVMKYCDMKNKTRLLVIVKAIFWLIFPLTSENTDAIIQVWVHLFTKNWFVIALDSEFQAIV